MSQLIDSRLGAARRRSSLFRLISPRPGQVFLALVLLAPAIWANNPPGSGARQAIDLDGSWGFGLDPMNAGLRERWHSAPGKIAGRIAVPGCWQALGQGRPMGAPRNHIDGATQIPAAGRTQPIVGGLRLTRSRPDNVVSRIAFLHEAHAGPGKVLLCGLNIRPNLDDQFPEAVFLLDRLLRYVSGPEFRPSTELSDNELNVNCIPYGVNGRPPKAGGAAGVVPREGGCP